jgi:hypothetical protein
MTIVGGDESVGDIRHWVLLASDSEERPRPPNADGLFTGLYLAKHLGQTSMSYLRKLQWDRLKGT